MSTGDADPGAVGTPELDALTNVVRALQGLSADGQRRVVESALVLLGTKASLPSDARDAAIPPKGELLGAPSGGPMDIRRLKEKKQPGSANEMAALVAYYLAEVAGGTERKPAVEISDVEKYFKQANFRLPKHPKMALVNAKNAGYFDATGGGKYKLNPVGYNLVVHSLPRTGTTERVKNARPRSTRRGAALRTGGRKRGSGSRAQPGYGRLGLNDDRRHPRVSETRS